MFKSAISSRAQKIKVTRPSGNVPAMSEVDLLLRFFAHVAETKLHNSLFYAVSLTGCQSPLIALLER